MKKFFRTLLGLCCSLILLGTVSGILWGASQPQDDKTIKLAKGGAQFWSENCARCHSMQSPASYNDKKWEIVVHQMRVRGNLTAEEHKKIVEFLKSGD